MKPARKIVLGRGWHGDINTRVPELLPPYPGGPRTTRYMCDLYDRQTYEHEHLYELQLVEVLPVRSTRRRRSK